ncbi:hypothetical protein ACFVQ4_14695 [Streptomyces laurentii]|uniref:hypothetical protein n=1 Tax=Streptomyces laurentii TaxID=39478 RepID=UPI00368B35FE
MTPETPETAPESSVASSAPEAVEAAEAAEAAGAPEAPAAPRAPRRVFPYVLCGVLVLGVAGGATYTGVTVSGADRQAPTVSWEKPPAAGEDPAAGTVQRGRSTTALSKLLLPVPEGYRLGPDIGRYGNDSEMSGDDATALMKESGKGLSGKKRREFDRRIEKLGIKGMAVRSYVSENRVRMFDVQVEHIKDQRVGREFVAIRRDLASLLRLGKGPKIEGHKNAFCSMLPKAKGESKDDDSSFDGMACAAYEGEYIVSVNAAETGSLDRAEIADLLKKQLDHIKSPGEYV